jgi:hypothetical protein
LVAVLGIGEVGAEEITLGEGFPGEDVGVVASGAGKARAASADVVPVGPGHLPAYVAAASGIGGVGVALQAYLRFPLPGEARAGKEVVSVAAMDGVATAAEVVGPGQGGKEGGEGGAVLVEGENHPLGGVVVTVSTGVSPGNLGRGEGVAGEEAVVAAAARGGNIRLT